MTPLDFLDFRDELFPASGFQSVQFRLIENKLGMRRGDRLQINDAPYTSRFTPEDAGRVEASEKEPSLFDLIQGWLERTPFLNFGAFDFWREYRQAVDAMLDADRASIRANPTLTDVEKTAQLAGVEATAGRFADLFAQNAAEPAPAPGRHLSRRALQAAVLINLYRDEPILHLPFRLLARPGGHRAELHDLAPAARPDGDAHDRHPDRHRRYVGSRVSRPRGRAPPRLRGPLGARELLHPAVGAPGASAGRAEPDGIPVHDSLVPPRLDHTRSVP